MTEREKMMAGKLYYPYDDELSRMRNEGHRLSKEYNDTYEFEEEKRAEILKKLIPQMGKGTYIQGPILFDYGVNTVFGENCYANFNLVVLDCGCVIIGNNVFFGPNCTIAAPVHPLLPKERKTNLEYGRSVIIEDDCWLASNVTVCGGVKIGKGCVIGAGSVVVKDIPEGSFAAGNPCRVIRKITKEDFLKFKPELF